MRWLDYWGVEVNYISSIDQFSSLKIQQIDMILLDDRDILAQEIQNLTQQISAWQLRRYLPVLLLTDPNTQVRECFKTIITNVLQWPLNLPKLYRSLTDAIQFSQSITRPLQVKIKSNILLVDDDLINLAAVKLHLERLGYIPDTVSNGFEALKLMTEKKYDLVIMDMRMGALDGHATTRSIRETFASDSQPIIAILTAGVTPNQLNALQNAGIDAYIEKPISVDKLVNLIEMTRLRGQTSSVSTHANIPASINQPVENIQSRVNIKTLSDLYKLSHADNSKNTMDVFQLFFQSAPEVMKQAIHAAHTNNIEKLKDMLHALKGTSEIYGAEFLSSLCKNLENDLEAKGNIDLKPRIEQIEAEYNVVHAMILAFQENPTPLINLTNQ
jgi:two-component system sensor histidine kinase BarA